MTDQDERVSAPYETFSSRLHYLAEEFERRGPSYIPIAADLKRIAAAPPAKVVTDGPITHFTFADGEGYEVASRVMYQPNDRSASFVMSVYSARDRPAHVCTPDGTYAIGETDIEFTPKK